MGQEAMAVLRLASSSEQSVLPYVHETAAGQHAGQAMSALGGAVGHGGLGGAFAASRHAPCVQRARRVPHAPKSHVVPSGSVQIAPFWGVAAGQSLGETEPPSPPPSAPGAVVARSSAHAAASATKTEPSTSARAAKAIGAVSRETRALRVREGATTRPE